MVENPARSEAIAFAVLVIAIGGAINGFADGGDRGAIVVLLTAIIGSSLIYYTGYRKSR